MPGVAHFQRPYFKAHIRGFGSAGLDGESNHDCIARYAIVRLQPMRIDVNVQPSHLTGVRIATSQFNSQTLRNPISQAKKRGLGWVDVSRRRICTHHTRYLVVMIFHMPDEYLKQSVGLFQRS